MPHVVIFLVVYLYTTLLLNECSYSICLLIVVTYTCASIIFLQAFHSSFPWCPQTRGSTHQGGVLIPTNLDSKTCRLNLFDSTKRGRNRCKLTKYLSKNLFLDLMSLDFVIIKKGEIVDINNA